MDNLTIDTNKQNHCAFCGTVLSPKKKDGGMDKRYCGSACRYKGWKAKLKAEAVEEFKRAKGENQ